MVRPPKILLVAGGSGGHILPAFALSQHLDDLPHVDYEFISGNRDIESTIYDSLGITPVMLCMSHFSGSLLHKASAALLNMRAVLKALRMLRHQRPAAIVAFGGYCSLPVLVAATLLRIPFYLQEQNALPGRVTRFFARKARAVFSAFPEAQTKIKSPRILVCGNPVRRSILNRPSYEQCRHFFGFNARERLLLVMGGSQGARQLNLKLLEVFRHLDTQLSYPLGIIWSAGNGNFADLAERIQSTRWRYLQFRLFPYIEAVEYAYGAADLVLSRAGATALAEIADSSLPCLLFPFPYATERHQHLNARVFEQAGAAISFDEQTLQVPEVAETLQRILEEPARYQAMKRAAEGLAHPQAAQLIANTVLQDCHVR